MRQRLTFAKLTTAIFVLAFALIMVGASSLVATEAEVAAEPTVNVLAAPAEELVAEQLTFPYTPWFTEPSSFLPGPVGIDCCPGSSCTADWQCGGGARGYCNAPGTCVCL